MRQNSVAQNRFNTSSRGVKGQNISKSVCLDFVWCMGWQMSILLGTFVLDTCTSQGVDNLQVKDVLKKLFVWTLPWSRECGL